MKQKLFNGAGLLSLLLVLILVAFNLGGLDPLVQQGVTHLSSLAVESGLTVTAGGLTVSAGASDLASTLQYGADDLYPVGFATSGQQAVYGTDAITGTASAAHGLTTVTFALCTLGEDPESGAGDGAMCTVSVSGNVVTLDIWQDDFVTAATETDVVIQWLVVGAP